MTTENSSEVQDVSTTQSTPEVTSAPNVQATQSQTQTQAQSATQSQTPTDQTTQGQQAPVVVPPTYAPNFKFKYGAFDPDKKDLIQKEAEIDELFRPLIKDADTEKKVRELYEKAYGLDYVKGNANKLKTERDEYKQKFTSVDKNLKTLGTYLQKKDYDSFFGALKITDEQIFEYTQRKLNEMQLSPEQKAQLEAQRQEKSRLYTLEEQNQELEQRYQQVAVQTRQIELQTVLNRPDVYNIASTYDQKVGKPGAFMNECIERGATAFYTTGRDLPAEEVVSQVLSKFGVFIDSNTQQVMNGQGAQGTQAPMHAQQPPPVIPHISGKATSPVKAKPKSIDELRKIANSAQ